MTPDHKAYCATLTGLPDICTCGAIFRSAAARGTPIEDDRRAAAAAAVLEQPTPPGNVARRLLALLGWALP